jgi:hypothetical protein
LGGRIPEGQILAAEDRRETAKSARRGAQGGHYERKYSLRREVPPPAVTTLGSLSRLCGTCSLPYEYGCKVVGGGRPQSTHLRPRMVLLLFSWRDGRSRYGKKCLGAEFCKAVPLSILVDPEFQSAELLETNANPTISNPQRSNTSWGLCTDTEKELLSKSVCCASNPEARSNLNFVLIIMKTCRKSIALGGLDVTGGSEIRSSPPPFGKVVGAPGRPDPQL